MLLPANHILPCKLFLTPPPPTSNQTTAYPTIASKLPFFATIFASPSSPNYYLPANVALSLIIMVVTNFSLVITLARKPKHTTKFGIFFLILKEIAPL
jgi:hypothetical protein